MDSAEWEAAARALAADHGRPRAIDGDRLRLALEPERRLLAEVDQLIRKAPDRLQEAFRSMSESDLARGASRKEAAIAEGRYGWRAGSPGTPTEWFIAAARQARALDYRLSVDSDTLFGEQARGDYWLIRDLGVYVLPRQAARLDGSEPKAGEPYSRRGLLHHRIVPAKVGDLTVGVAYVPMGGGSYGAGTKRFGAAMFVGGALETMPAALPHGPAGFLAASYPVADATEALAGHVAEAHRSGCQFAVWPELTMPPDRRDELSRLLAMEAFRNGGRGGLEIAVAGSWHEQEAGVWRNTAIAYDRSGVRLAHHSKLTPYFGQGTGVECIEPGDEIQLVATSHLVVAIGICKDVCDLARPNPYLELPVDVLLVPSMGNRETATGHDEAAVALRLRNNTILFVVQQGEGTPPLGYVVCSAVGRRRGRFLFEQTGPWRVY